MNKVFIQKLTDLVEANLADETFGTEELAREMGMSHSNLGRKLKSITNQTISQFIREVRLKKAKELLRNEDMTVAEISYRVGFGSPTYFNKCFHEYFGYAPGELRNQELESETEEQPVYIEPLPKKHSRRKILVSLLISLVVVIPLAFFLINRISGSITEKSIAVLPFKYLSDEPNKQYIAEGLMDGILQHLSKIYDLRVIPRTSVEQYRNTDKTAKTIGKELDAAFLLEGSFLKVGNQFKLVLQLINTKEESHVWTSEYNGDKETIFDIQSKATEAIARELNAEVTPEEQQNIRKVPTTNLSAYDFYQKGKEYEDGEKSKSVENNLEKARVLYQKALDCDSTFAMAYVGLARIYWAKHQWPDYLKENYQKYLDSVLILVNLALAYDDQCAEAYLLRGKRYDELKQSDLAIKEYDKAIKYNPNDGTAYDLKVGWGRIDDPVESISMLHEMVNRFHGSVWLLYRLGNNYLGAGFPEMAKPYFEQILELEPDSAFYFYSMSYYENAKQNYEAAYQYHKKISTDTINPPTDEYLGFCMKAGKYEEAYRVVKKYSETFLKPGNKILNFWLHPTMGYVFWQAGDKKKAKYYFDEAINHWQELIKLGRLEEGNFIFCQLAGIYAFLGDKGKAYYYLDKYHIKKSYAAWEAETLKDGPEFNSIRNEPRFQTIAKDVETQYLADYLPKHEKVRKWLVSKGMLEPDAK